MRFFFWHRRRRAVAIVLLVATGPVAGSEQVSIGLGTLQGEGWSVRGARLSMDLSRPGRIGVRLRASGLDLPPPLDKAESVEVVCAELRLDREAAVCPNGTIRLKSPLLDRSRIPMAFRYQFGDGTLDLSLRDARLAGGRARLDIEFTPDSWTVAFTAAELNLAVLRQGWEGMVAFPPEWSGSGILGAKGRLSGGGNGLRTVQADLSIIGLGFEEPAGRLAGEGIDLALTVSGRRLRAGTWKGESRLVLRSGGLYIEPVFLEIAEVPIRMEANGSWEEAGKRLRLDHLSYVHPGAIEAQGAGQFALEKGVRLGDTRLTVSAADMGTTFATYLQPFLVGTALEPATLAGKASLALSISASGRWRGELILEDIDLQDSEERYALEGLRGKLAWNPDDGSTHSWLRWHAGRFYRLPFGGAEVRVAAGDDGLRLVAPVKVPVLDGGLQVTELELEGIREGPRSFRLNGVIEPVDLERLTTALEIQPLPGTLSAVIPDVTFRNGELGISGALLINAFDGDMIVRGLRLQEPLGALPILSTDVEIRNLDLESLTRTFSFGKMEGRLDGRMVGLRLEGWRPVAFDARFATPKGDRSRRRISQRAVDNLTNLGGSGVGGALSRSFLRMFENFSYARVGLSCTLANGVCEMDGVEPAQEGYYIVKGGGLPRIDVIGYTRRVDWDVLLARLRRITSTGEAVVE